jgi:hypothetical protein
MSFLAYCNLMPQSPDWHSQLSRRSRTLSGAAQQSANKHSHMDADGLSIWNSATARNATTPLSRNSNLPFAA